MGWSVFDGTPADSHEDLFRFARLQTPNGKAVLAGLEWADDPDWYVAHALDNGFKPSAADVISILEDWGYSDQEGLLYRCLGPFTQAQVLLIAELVDEGLVTDFVTKSRSFGAEYDDAGIVELGELTGDSALFDSLVSARIVEKGPYKPWEQVRLGLIIQVEHEVARLDGATERTLVLADVANLIGIGLLAECGAA